MIVALIIVFVVVIPALTLCGEVSDIRADGRTINELDVE